jgi:hypothetical protein
MYRRGHWVTERAVTPWKANGELIHMIKVAALARVRLTRL